MSKKLASTGILTLVVILAGAIAATAYAFKRRIEAAVLLSREASPVGPSWPGQLPIGSGGGSIR